jgi:serine/threonine protein kinase
MKMLVQHVEAAPVPPSRRTELPIPPELDEMVLRCLEKDPSRRPQSAEELFAVADGCTVCRTWTRAEARTW